MPIFLLVPLFACYVEVYACVHVIMRGCRGEGMSDGERWWHFGCLVQLKDVFTGWLGKRNDDPQEIRQSNTIAEASELSLPVTYRTLEIELLCAF